MSILTRKIALLSIFLSIFAQDTLAMEKGPKGKEPEVYYEEIELSALGQEKKRRSEISSSSSSSSSKKQTCSARELATNQENLQLELEEFFEILPSRTQFTQEQPEGNKLVLELYPLNYHSQEFKKISQLNPLIAEIEITNPGGELHLTSINLFDLNQAFKKIKILRLSNINLINSSIYGLELFPELTTLYLNDNPALTSLAGLLSARKQNPRSFPKLTHLDISRTGVTSQQLSKLRELFPEVTIITDLKESLPKVKAKKPRRRAKTLPTLRFQELEIGDDNAPSLAHGAQMYRMLMQKAKQAISLAIKHNKVKDFLEKFTDPVRLKYVIAMVDDSLVKMLITAISSDNGSALLARLKAVDPLRIERLERELAIEQELTMLNQLLQQAPATNAPVNLARNLYVPTPQGSQAFFPFFAS